jgi:hypothetical protein
MVSCGRESVTVYLITGMDEGAALAVSLSVSELSLQAAATVNRQARYTLFKENILLNVQQAG